MKKIIAVLSLCLLTAISAHATISKEEKAKELMNLMNVQAIYDTVYAQAVIPITCEMVMSADDEAKLKKDFMRIADMDSLVKTLRQFWLKNYSEQELDELIAFYKTDLGKKAIRLLPEYTQYSMIEIQKWGEKKKHAFINLGRELAQKHPRRSGEEAKACIKSKMGM